MKKFILIIILNSLFATLFCQSIESTFEFATNQFNEENYDAAISAYRRTLFFDKNKLSSKIYLNLAECYLNTSNYEKSHYYFDLAYHSTNNDSIKIYVILKQTFIYIINKQYNYGLIELAGLNNFPEIIDNKQANLYKAIILYQQKKFTESQKYFHLGIENKNIYKTAKIDSLINISNKLSGKNTKNIYYASIIPGLGHLLAGYPKEAVNSFLLTTGLLALYTYTIIQYSYFDGLIAVIPWFQRYYMGGFESSEKLYIEKIEKEQNVIYMQIIDLVSR